MYPVLFYIGGQPVISWTVLALIGCWAAYFSLAADLARARIPGWQIIAFFAGCIAVWFGGAYLGHSWTVGRTHGLLDQPRFQFAGFVLYGGVLAVIAYGFLAWIGFGWNRKMLVQELWDRGAVALAWALFFGRLGCVLYGCCYGTPAGSWPGYSLNEAHWDPENHTFPAALRGVRLHPAPLYEALGVLAILGVLYWVRSRERRVPGSFPPGVTGWICWIGYGIVRFNVEFIRLDPRGGPVGGLSPSQWIAVVTVLLGAGLVRWDWGKRRTPLVNAS
jgi:phosphatidylglycerol:prolipoprotein diacylglycerol transferase